MSDDKKRTFGDKPPSIPLKKSKIVPSSPTTPSNSLFKYFKKESVMDSPSSNPTTPILIDSPGDSPNITMINGQMTVDLTTEEDYIPTYYLTNFFLVFDVVLEKDSHLFDQEELDMLAKFKRLKEDSHRLFIRLHHRKRKWFQTYLISYREIFDVSSALDPLITVGFLEKLDLVKHDDQYKQILSIFTLEQLKPFISTSVTKGVKKDGLIDLLLAPKQKSFFSSDSNSIMKKIVTKLGPLVTIPKNVVTLMSRINRLFFLNETQTSNDLLLQDLKIFVYPTYKCQPSSIFTDKKVLLEYEQSVEYLDLLTKYMEEKKSKEALEIVEIALSMYQKCEKIQEENYFLLRYRAPYNYAAIMNEGVTLYEQDKNYQKATSILKLLLDGPYLKSKRGKWWNRLALDFEHIKDLDKAYEVCNSALEESTLPLQDLLTIEKRILRIYKKLSKEDDFLKDPVCKIESTLLDANHVYIQGVSITKQHHGKSKYLLNQEMLSVEDYVSDYYRRQFDYDSIHSEGSVWMNIFGLIFWDIIYADVPFVFQTKFQTAPLDFRTDAFYESRKDLITYRLELVEKDGFLEIMSETWQKYTGLSNACIRWDNFTLKGLMKIASLTGGKILCKILLLLAQNIKNLKGMPDLVLFNDSKLILSEVKSQNDHLSDHQRFWIHTLVSAGATVEVCHVVEKLPTEKKQKE